MTLFVLGDFSASVVSNVIYSNSQYRPVSTRKQVYCYKTLEEEEMQPKDGEENDFNQTLFSLINKRTLFSSCRRKKTKSGIKQGCNLFPFIAVLKLNSERLLCQILSVDVSAYQNKTHHRGSSLPGFYFRLTGCLQERASLAAALGQTGRGGGSRRFPITPLH